jgi:AraC-like DNA-binding protein
MLLAKKNKAQNVENFPVMPYEDVPAFFAGGICNWRATTLHAFLRQTRLQLVCDELLRSGETTDVTTAALRYGFSHLGRFSAYYRSAFGEAPSVTVRRGRASMRRV